MLAIFSITFFSFSLMSFLLSEILLTLLVALDKIRKHTEPQIHLDVCAEPNTASYGVSRIIKGVLSVESTFDIARVQTLETTIR